MHANGFFFVRHQEPDNARTEQRNQGVVEDDGSQSGLAIEVCYQCAFCGQVKGEDSDCDCAEYRRGQAPAAVENTERYTLRGSATPIARCLDQSCPE